MPIHPMRPAALALTVALLSACGGGPPDVPSAYRERLDQAWTLAGRGENPTGACTMVVGAAVGRGSAGADADARADAARAYLACYVDISARYLQTLVDQAEAGGGDPCGRLATHMAIWRMSLGGFAVNLGLDRAELDARHALRIADAVRARCPGQAEAILGG